MKLSAPSKPLFIVSLVLFIIALLGTIGIGLPIPAIILGWSGIAAWVVLAIGCVMTGM